MPNVCCLPRGSEKSVVARPKVASGIAACVARAGVAFLVCALGVLSLRTAQAQYTQPPASPYIWLRADECATDGNGCTNLGTSGLAIIPANPAQQYRAQWSADRLAGEPALQFTSPAHFVTQNVVTAPFSAEYTQTSVVEMPSDTSAYGPMAWLSNDYMRVFGGVRHISVAVYYGTFLMCQSEDIGATGPMLVQECTYGPPQPPGRKIVTVRATANRRELWINGSLAIVQTSPTVPVRMQLITNAHVLGENMLYTRTLNDQELYQLHSYLSRRYDIPLGMQQSPLPPGAAIWVHANACAPDGSSCTNLTGSGAKIAPAGQTPEWRPQLVTTNPLRGRATLRFTPPANLSTMNQQAQPFVNQYTVSGLVNILGPTNVYGPMAWLSNDYARANGAIRHASIAIYLQGMMVCQSPDVGAGNQVVQECMNSPPIPPGPTTFTLRAFPNRRELWINGSLVASQNTPTIPVRLQLIVAPQVLAEEVVYPRALSDTELTAVHQHFNSVYVPLFGEGPGYGLDPLLSAPGTTTPDPADGAQDPVSVVKIGDETIEFVANQLVLESSEPTVVAAFNARYGGTVVETIDFPSEPEDDLQNVLGIRLDVNRMADPASVAVALAAVEPELAGRDLYFSDLLGARLFATWLEARSLGFEVDIDLLNDGEPGSACDDRPGLHNSVTQDGSPSSPVNVFNLAELSLTRVPQAWQKLSLAGRYVKSVQIASVDRGFVNAVPEHDYDGDPTCARDEPCKRRNQVDSEDRWRWHGANVSYVLMGAADNQRGAAGVAGRVADVAQWEDPGRYRARLRVWRRVMRDEYDIMTSSIGLGGDARKRLRLRYNRVIRRVARKGLLFASAGNEGRSGFVECDFENVQCVGGLLSDGSGIHPESNHSGRVDFWTPYVFVEPGIDLNGASTNSLVVVGGTSYSAPHAAGIAALALAANPTWRTRDGAADRKLRHRDTVVGTLKSCNQPNRAMDAACVVRKALEAANAPPAACILEPLASATYDYEDQLHARAALSDWGDPQSPAWSIDGVAVGSINPLTTFIPGVGSQQLTLAYGSASDSAQVTRLEPAAIKVTEPPTGACIREADARSGVTVHAFDMFPVIGAPAPQFDWTGNGLALGTGNGMATALPNANAGTLYQVDATLDDGIGMPKRGTSIVRIVSNAVARVSLTITGIAPRELLGTEVRTVTASVTTAPGDALPSYQIVWLLQRTTGQGDISLGTGPTWPLDGAMLNALSATASWQLVARLVAQVDGASCSLASDEVDVTQTTPPILL